MLITHGHSDHAAECRRSSRGGQMCASGSSAVGEQPIADEEVIEAGDGALTAVHTPGHSPDHCCFLDGRDLYCGDLVQAGATVVIPASRGGDLSVYIDSLERVRRLQVRRLLPGHGPIDRQPRCPDSTTTCGTGRGESGRSSTYCCPADRRRWTQIVSRIYAGLAPALLSSGNRDRARALDEAGEGKASDAA